MKLPLVYGARGPDVLELQEWLVVRGYKPWSQTPPGIDADYGPATKTAVESFASAESCSPVVDETFWARLTAPMTRAFTFKPAGPTLGQAVVQVAQAHLLARPREARCKVNGFLYGVDNSGPWVKRYCAGLQAQWCQGQASSIVRQAAAALGVPVPFKLDGPGVLPLYVPSIVEEAARAGRYVQMEGSGPGPVPPGSMFFVRGYLNGEWSHVHVGIVTAWNLDGTFKTVEGNTSDDGSSNGWLTMEHIRRPSTCDFGVIK